MNIRLLAKRHRPLITLGDSVLTYHIGSICLIDLKSGQITKVCALPMKSAHRFLVRFRVFERLLRLEAKAAVALSDTVALVSYLGAVYRLDIASGKIAKEHTYRFGMNNPLYFTKIEGVPGFPDCIAYGEYILNSSRTNPSAVYIRSLHTPEWHKAFEFETGVVRHIHGLRAMPEDSCVYIMTGDRDSESGIWSARDGFQSVVPVLSGRQKYRTGFMFPVEKGFLYPTDTATEQNYLCLLKTNELQPSYETIAELDGSCVSAAETDDDIFVVTAVEPDESVTGWRSWINYRRGAGIKSQYSQLIRIDKKSLKQQCVFKVKKDVLPYKLFQYGSMILAKGPDMNSLLVYPVGVKNHDGKLYLFS